MHIQTNRWIEERIGQRYVGCCGYDDPVYEDYTYTENCSENVVVFDDRKEKKAFHKMVVALKQRAERSIKNREQAILKQFKVQYQIALSKFNSEVKAFKERDAARSWLGRIFTDDSAPQDKPEWSGYNGYKQDSIEKAWSDKHILAARLIIKHPESFDKFIKPLTEEQYNTVLWFKGLLSND